MARAETPKVFLVDGHALVYRAFYAMISRPLRTSHGENTSAPWGVAQFIKKTLAEQRPDFLGFIFDAGGTDTFRHEIYEDYKATREKLDETLQEDFDTAMRRIRQILAAFNIPVIELEGYEADDVIGTLARQVNDSGLQAIIVSGDKDFYQLIDEGVALLNPGRGGPAAVEAELVDPTNAAARLGVPPQHVTDYLALVGDSSDNIPGVRGIGPKTAVQLIGQYGSLEDILDHADGLSQKRPREALKQHAAEARLSKDLVTIRTDLPIELNLDDLTVGEPNREALRDLFLELEFHSLVREYAPEGPAKPHKEVPEPGYETVNDVSRLQRLVQDAQKRGRFAVDVRTAKTTTGRADLVGLSLAAQPGRAVYLPLNHLATPPGELALGDSSDEAADNLSAIGSAALKLLASLLRDDRVEVIGHDLKSCLPVLRSAGLELAGAIRDVMIESYCLDPGRRQHDLETLVLEEFGQKLTAYEEVCGKGKSAIPFSHVEVAAAARFSAERADFALRVDERLTRQLDDYGLRQLFDEVEMPLMPVLADMEEAGVAIDREFFAAMGERLQSELELVEEEIYKLSGRELNINSPIQLREVLFDRMGLPVKKRTKTGPSTDAEVLEELAAEGHQLPRLIIEFRELAKLKSTYVDALPALADENDRIHTSFNQTVASTGRLSSSDPNLQNIPIRTTLGAEIRKGFVPGPGLRFLGADYSQIELRILAHLSGDPAFVEAFNAGRDVHRETAALIFNAKPEAVTPAMRGQAKTVNFATIYGQGPMALARQLGISVTQARAFIDNYFTRFPAIREYLDRQVELARDEGYVETLFGRRRYIPELNSKNPNIRGFGERVATNSPIQGTAADLIKLAMINIHRKLGQHGDRSRMILQVHDELLFEVHPDDTERVTALVKREMEGALDLDVPIAVDMGVGRNWYETKAV
jgi:DNA polymerase-1